MATSQSWREAQNKMNIVLVCCHSVEMDFDITSVYEDMKGKVESEKERVCEREREKDECV